MTRDPSKDVWPGMLPRRSGEDRPAAGRLELEPAHALAPAGDRPHPSGGGGEVHERVRVLVSARHAVLRAGIAALVEPQHCFEVVQTGLDPTSLAAAARGGEHDVLLVQTTAEAGLACLLSGRDSDPSHPAPAVVALLAEDRPDPVLLAHLVRQGVDGIVTADDSRPQLCGALLAVRRGHRWLSPSLGGPLMEALARLATEAPAADGGPGPCDGRELSRAERSVLALVAEGLTVCQIARRLHRSEGAVKYHLANMSARYQASNRAHLVYLAVRAGALRIG